MKKLLSIMLAFVIAAALLTVPAFASSDVKVLVNGTEVTFDQPPVIEDGRTLVPARAVFEAMGASVFWDPAVSGGYVSVVTNSKSVVLYVSEADSWEYMLIDNFNKVSLDVPAKIKDGRTLVPLRAIGDALSFEVGWDGETRTASLTYEFPESDKLSEDVKGQNEALSFQKAGEQISYTYDINVLTEIPKYKNGVKYYEGIAKEKSKSYISKADGSVNYEDYPVYASVNDEIISYDEYSYFIGLYSDAEGNISEENKKLAEKEIIELAVSAAKAKEMGVKQDKNFILANDYYLYNLCYGMDVAAFSSVAGMKPASVYAIAEKFALRNSVYTMASANGDIDVSDAAINSKFEQMFYKAKHILFKTVDDNMQELSKSQKSKQKKLAETTLKKIKNGEDFDTLMKELSEDGSMSFEGYVFTDGEMVSAFENAVKGLKADELSGIVETEYGYHIIKRLPLSAETENETVAAYKGAIQNQIASEYFASNTDKWAASMKIVKY